MYRNAHASNEKGENHIPSSSYAVYAPTYGYRTKPIQYLFLHGHKKIVIRSSGVRRLPPRLLGGRPARADERLPRGRHYLRAHGHLHRELSRRVRLDVVPGGQVPARRIRRLSGGLGCLRPRLSVREGVSSTERNQLYVYVVHTYFKAYVQRSHNSTECRTGLTAGCNHEDLYFRRWFGIHGCRHPPPTLDTRVPLSLDSFLAGGICILLAPTTLVVPWFIPHRRHVHSAGTSHFW